MKLILVRHGQTNWVRAGRYQGASDIPLNSFGKRQARAVARVLKKETPFSIYSSKLARARQTANEIARACRKRVMIDDRLNEISFGLWEGHTYRQVRARHPNDMRTWHRASWSSRPSGGESLRSLKKRVLSFLEALKRKHGKRRGHCVVVCHGGVVRMFMICALSLSPATFWSFRVDLASISVFSIKSNAQEVVLLNSLDHLTGLKQERG
jgi:alpha-ribazole phosphatase